MKKYIHTLSVGLIAATIAFSTSATAVDKPIIKENSCGFQKHSPVIPTLASLNYWRQCEQDSDCGTNQKCCHKAESDGNGTRCVSKSTTGNCYAPKSN